MTKFVLIGLFLLCGNILSAQNDTDKVMFNVDLNPTWPGCDEMNDSIRKKCLETRLAGFFDDFILYPDRAKQKRVSGVVVVQFIVEKDGSISNLRILHDIGGGCGEEVIRALQHLPQLIPGENDGKKVRVVYKASFNFKLK